MKIAFVAALLFISQIVFANYPKQYFVAFNFKKSNYSLQSPQNYLSARAIARRNRQGIAIDSLDLPVVPFYLDSIKKAGLQIVGITKWLNGVIVNANDSVALNHLQQMWFVKNFVQVKDAAKSAANISKFGQENFLEKASSIISATDISGYAATQIEMLHGEVLHQQGFTGEGMQIAILDGGFTNVNKNLAFQNLWHENRMLGFYDFVHQQDSVFTNAAHGSNVLSLMAGNYPNTFMGTASSASFYLFETENDDSEYPVEEYFWSVGAEKADSLGVDLFNTSLGYTQFDNSKFNHTNADMDGKTTPAAKAASIAGSRGILICIAAGNEGSANWHFISTPADANNILTVGSVNSNREHSIFSSWGPSADGRIKPDVCTMGEKAVVINTSNELNYGSGTSYASPILCGMVACLWQKYPNKTAAEIRDAVRQSAHLFQNPNGAMGYGIPDFRIADMLLSGKSNALLQTSVSPFLFPNPSMNVVSFYFYSNANQQAYAELFDVSGKKIMDTYFNTYQNTFDSFQWNEVNQLERGVYFIQLQINQAHITLKFVKQ